MAAESAVRIIFLGDSSQAVRSVSRLESAFGGLGRTTKLLAGAMGIALVGGMAAATKSAIEFQHQMELIHTQAGASAKEVDKMSKAVIGLAASVGTGPEDLAKGLFHIESAGIRGAHALDILRAAAQGAKVGGANLEDTTNALIGAFTSGVKGAGSMEHAMAVLNATVGAGNMRMSDLTSAMGTGLLSAARGVGISMQDVGAALAELTVQNENASEASTRLQMAFLTMAASTTKGAAALKSIGITQSQLATDMRSHGLIFALQDLQTHLQASGKTATEQTAIIADVFGRRSLKAILPLLQHLDDVRKRQEQITKTTGNFGQAWEATTQTVQFQMDRAKAAIQAAFIPIGTLLLPLVAQLAKAVGSAAQFIGQHSAQIKAAFQQIGDVLHGVVSTVQQNLTLFETLAGAIIGATTALLAYRTAVAVAAAAQAAFNLVVEANPYVLAATAIAAVIGALVALELKFHFVEGAVAAVRQAFSSAFHTVLNVIETVLHAFDGIPARIAAAFTVGPIMAVIGAIKDVIGVIQDLIGWIDKIPHIASNILGGGAAHRSTSGPGTPRGFPAPVPAHAEGGFVQGTVGAPKLVLAHAGEVILNPMQQAAFGGAAFFKQTFGFTEGGSSFAAGGIVSSRQKPRRSPHHPVRSRYKTTSGRAKAALKGVDAINQDEADADRGYGQLVRQYQIADTDLQFVRYDDVGNAYLSQPDISQRVGEIDELIAARQHMLDLLAEEKKKLKAAIEDLRKAIAAMVKQIKQERKAIADLAKKMSTERRKKKPNQNVINKLQAQISAGGTRIGNLTSGIGEFQRAIGDQNLNLNHQLPFDVRDVQLDIAQLQQERKDDIGTTVPTSVGGGATTTVAATVAPSVDVSALIAQIARLNLALGIQTAQQTVIGSFAKGTLSVPETGLALVHAGEQIVPAGQVRGSSPVSPAPVHVEIKYSNGLEWLNDHVSVLVDGKLVEQGRKAAERARSGRY